MVRFVESNGVDSASAAKQDDKVEYDHEHGEGHEGHDHGEL